MGSYNGAEVCELVGLFLLDELAELLGKENVGLYRDDGLAIINGSGPFIERTKKKILKVFQKHNLQVTTECNLVRTDFLDVSFDLQSKSYKPFRKPGDTPLYINVRSNHPTCIKEEIPKMISERISSTSSGPKEFNEAAQIYNTALKTIGYKENIGYRKIEAKRKNSRKRNILCCNPPFSVNVATNVGKEFFQLINKYFPPHHRLHKIINQNCVKMSYSCMPNIGDIISMHNKATLQQSDKKTKDGNQQCNCRDRSTCPIERRCKEGPIVYKATLTSQNKSMVYYGSCETEFKIRYNNHKQSFKFENKKHATELSKAVWNVKDAGETPLIEWSIVKRVPPYQCGSQICQLCLAEKMSILQAREKNLLNKRSELVSNCRHTNKFLLKNVRLKA